MGCCINWYPWINSPLVLEWAKTRGELIQKSFLKNLIFGVFRETKLFDFFLENIFWKCQLKFPEDVPYGDGFSFKLRVITGSKSTTIGMFIARRRRKFWQNLVYKITFFVTKTMILKGFPKQNEWEFSKFSAFGSNFGTSHMVFLGPAANLNLHFWTFQSHW